MRVPTVVALGLIALIAVATLSGCSGQQPSLAAASPTSTPVASADPTSTPAPESTPSPSGAFGGIVQYQLDGAPATTEVDVVADGASVSGTAVTTFREGTHTVRLGCATQNADTWALGGTIEQTTVPGERAGGWSAVIVKDGSPQQIAIWLSGDPSDASDCEAWLASTDFANIGPENFNPVESGALVPPA